MKRKLSYSGDKYYSFESEKLQDLYNKLTVEERNGIPRNLKVNYFDVQETAWDLKIRRFELIRAIVEYKTRQAHHNFLTNTRIGEKIKRIPEIYKSMEESILKTNTTYRTPFWDNVQFILYYIFKLSKLMISFYRYEVNAQDEEFYILNEKSFVDPFLLEMKNFVDNIYLVIHDILDEEHKEEKVIPKMIVTGSYK